MGTVNVEVADLVATVTFDRPPVNAIDFASMAELTQVFTSFTERRDVRVVIFTATSERAFIAGVDLADVAGRDAAEAPAKTVVDPGHVARDLMWAIADCAVPVIAAVTAPPPGARLAFAARRDILLASEYSTFGTTEINVGLLGASAHLSLLVGRHTAREMFVTGEQVPARELHRVGAVRAVVPRDELLATAIELALSLAAKSPIAMRLAKEAMNRVEFLPLRDAYRIEQDYTNRMLRYEDAAEARAAFLEKRPPSWHWK
jgi:enoyl-CoA hydratase